jgi:hypothetical protein
MPMTAIKKLAVELASFGLNTLVMEYEAAFPFKKHAVISNRYVYTPKEIQSLVSHCRKLGIGVIPLKQCFGHSEYILRHPRYKTLREDQKEISQVCPLKEKEAEALFTDLFSDMVSFHPSPFFHIGGDETYLLGQCPACADKAAREGKSRLFVDYMAMICGIVKKLGKRPVLWADIILKHPEAVERLPKDAIFVDWNYGWEFDRFGNVPALQARGCEFWGAPALRSSPDNWYLTSWEKHFNNLRDFVPHGRELRYTGMVLTSWSTSGIYGYEWDTNYEVIDMHPIRRVYPLSGFRILLAAYAEALKQQAALDPAAFANAYAAERFGLTEKEADRFYPALISDPPRMDGFRPKRNVREFEHYRLMADIRNAYLYYRNIARAVQQEAFRPAGKRRAAQSLKRVLWGLRALEKRFTALQKGFLFDGEIRAENEARIRPVELLYKRLAGKRD